MYKVNVCYKKINDELCYVENQQKELNSMEECISFLGKLDNIIRVNIQFEKERWKNE